MSSWQALVRVHPTDPELFYQWHSRATTMWQNDVYVVIHEPEPPSHLVSWPGWAWLSIRRRDREAVRDWRDLQRIKSEVCGPDREAIEVYPTEARVVDCANQTHLWVLPEGIEIGVGWREGMHATPEDAEAFGARQRSR